MNSSPLKPFGRFKKFEFELKNMFRKFFPKISRRKFGTILTIYIMKLLREREKSIPEVIKIIEEETGRKMSKGTIYPIFSSLKEEGLIRSKRRGRVEVFYLSKKGESFLTFLQRKKDYTIKHLRMFSKLIVDLIAEDERSREIGEVLSSIISKTFKVKDKEKVLKILKRCENALEACS